MNNIRTPNIVHMEFGSKLYGTSDSLSDTDYADIYMPTMTEILLQKKLKTVERSTGNDKEANSPDDVDVKSYSLPVFLGDCLRGDTTALDMLHCDQPLFSTWVWEDLVKNREKFYTAHMKAYVGFCKKQAHKYGLKGYRLLELETSLAYLTTAESVYQPTTKLDLIWKGLPEGEYIEKIAEDGTAYYLVLGKKYEITNTIGYVRKQLQKKYDAYGNRAHSAKENSGRDWKAISHSLRVAYQVRAILEYGDFRYPLVETDFIRDVKRGRVTDYAADIAPQLDLALAEIEALEKYSTLPAEPDYEYWDKWLVGTYDKWFNIQYLENPDGH